MADLLLAIALIALAPVAAAQDAAASIAAELRAAQQCDDHQEPRRCVTAAGAAAFECRVKSPLAGLLHWFERGDAGDSVLVLVDAAPATVTVTERTAQRTVERRVEVRDNESIPQCKNSHLGEQS